MATQRAFPLNAWYAAAWDAELRHELFPRTVANKKIVLYRRSDGRPVALEDACWHRLLPLSKGRLKGDELVCGYHGLKFDVGGQCVEVPGQSLVPRGARVRSYPVREKWSVAWIWMGDPAKADESKIPNLPWLADPGWTATPGRRDTKFW